MEQKIRVALQGFSRDLSVANGSYDPVELGEMSADQFYQLLMRIKHARIPAVSSQAGQDLCPPVATARRSADALGCGPGSVGCSSTPTMVPRRGVPMPVGPPTRQE